MNTHYNNNSLLLFLYEELSGNELQAMQEHLSKCNACQRELTILQETLNLYLQLPLEVPSQEILLGVLTQDMKAPSMKSRLMTMLKSLFPMRPRRWAIVSLCGILLVVGVAHFSSIFLPSKSSNVEIELEWKGSLSSSLEVISSRISLMQEGSIPLSGTTNASMFVPTQTIEAEIFALNKRIEDFSTSLTRNTF